MSDDGTTPAGFALQAANLALEVARDAQARVADVERRLAAIEVARPAAPEDTLSPVVRMAYRRATADLLPIDKRVVRAEVEKWRLEPGITDDEIVTRLNRGALVPDGVDVEV